MTFHSIEDKIVKFFFNNFSKNKAKPSRYFPESNADRIVLFEEYKNKVIRPSRKEVEQNNRSRSAKLRCLIKKENIYDFKTDILDKFKDLIEIENLGHNL